METNKYSNAIEKIINEADDLPSLPFITQKILKLTYESDISLSEISKVVSSDAAMAARFLKIVNSAYYGFTSKVQDINHAVTILGMLAIRNIAITLSLFDVFPVNQSREYEDLFRRSLTTAIAADFISQIDGNKAHPDVFLAGLLQNLGMFILMRYLPQQYMQILITARKFSLDPRIVEDAELGTNNMRIGEQIGKRWKLPIIIRAAMQYKAGIRQALDLNIPDEAKIIVKATYCGGLASDIFWGWNKAQSIALFKKELTEFFDCEANTAEDILSSLPQLIEDSGFMEPNTLASIPSYESIVHDAEDELILTSSKLEKLYKLYMDNAKKFEQQNEQNTFLKNELERSNNLVQKLALKLQS